ncbi:MAG: NAD-dependent epimerase/dehydratase family protein [Burkholderiaceae bacterium]|nr:NAD-dependent epimerase/dehydratase family protein [Burkholderiaceae bacterium]
MNAEKTVLVLGASGGIGGEVARQMRDAGWTVKALKRGMAQASEQRDGMLWLRGDALDAADVAQAAQGCSVLVHAVNPPGYRNWSTQVLPMLDNTIAAARRSGALVVLPGTVYNYGPDAFPLVTEASPQHPVTRKGAIRVEMEQRLRAYAQQGGRVLVLRAGDFFGPQAGNSWFSQGLVKPGQAVTRISNPADRGVGHQWAYLPDVARTMLALIGQRDRLEPFATFHLGGHWDADGTAMARAIARVVLRHGGKAPVIGAMPWWLLTLASPFVATLRELLEMRYLWRQPVRMENAKLVAALGAEPLTALDDAVEATLLGLGCLPRAPAALPAS